MLIGLSILLVCSAAAIAIGLTGCSGGSCLGCNVCQIGAETFTTADSGTIPGFTQVSGSSAIVSNKLKMTASNTLVIFDTADATGGIEVNAQVDCIGANSNDAIWLLIKEKNGTGDDAFIAELIIGTSKTLKLFHRTGGSDGSALATTTITTTPGTTYTLKVCYGDGQFSATVAGTFASTALATTIADQLNAGLACGAITSNVQFANFVYNHGYNASSNPTCAACSGSSSGSGSSSSGSGSSGPAPTSCYGSSIILPLSPPAVTLTATASVAFSGNYDCTSPLHSGDICSDLSGTFVLNRHNLDPMNAGYYCHNPTAACVTWSLLPTHCTFPAGGWFANSQITAAVIPSSQNTLTTGDVWLLRIDTNTNYLGTGNDTESTEVVYISSALPSSGGVSDARGSFTLSQVCNAGIRTGPRGNNPSYSFADPDAACTWPATIALSA